MNSLYNNDNFLPEGNRCNFETLQIYGPCQMTYAEPTPYQIEELEKEVGNIINILLTDEYVYNYCATLFNYRIGKAQSLVKNLYLLFETILSRDVNFTYSPQFGINLWPGHLGYFKNELIENIIRSKESLFFTDFITETTTFLRYHIKFRFNNYFGLSFKKKFIFKITHALLLFAAKIHKLHVMQHSIINALDLIIINRTTNR